MKIELKLGFQSISMNPCVYRLSSRIHFLCFHEVRKKSSSQIRALSKDNATSYSNIDVVRNKNSKNDWAILRDSLLTVLTGVIVRRRNNQGNDETVKTNRSTKRENGNGSNVQLSSISFVNNVTTS